MCQRYEISLISLILLATTQAYTQPDISRIKVADSLLRHHVFSLAADSLQGRATGTKDQLKAAFYCTQVLRRNRMLPVFRLDSIRASFYQQYAFKTVQVTPFGKSFYSSVPATFDRNELVSLPLPTKPDHDVLFGHNVAGLLIGTDLKQEVIVLSAHFDHLGISGGRIFHGADDNASGTATILSAAAVFDSLAQLGIRPRRSILFVLFSGEEGGLIGSEYFIRNSPIPLQQMVCDLNVDMVGRVDYQHKEKPDYCYLLAGKQDHTLREAVGMANKQSVAIELDYTHDTENDPNQYFFRSDQFNFAQAGIPVLFFMDGKHPDYHKSSDTADKIVYEVLQKRATLVWQTAWLLANPTP